MPRNVDFSTSISLSDSTLNRFGDMQGDDIMSCSTGGATAYPYQRTRAIAYADGLDVTALVSFAVADTAVADVSSTRFDAIQGKSAGSTSVHLGGLVGSEPSAPLEVSDTLVSASSLVARVVTGAAWRLQPSVQFSVGEVVLARALLSNSMMAEGDSGFMFSQVVWSDGATEDVGYSPAADVEELGVEVGSAGVSVTAPSVGSPFWQLGVAVGAVKECVDSVVATWKVCGSDVVSGVVPLFLDLPDPLSARLTIEQTRLTTPTDDARHHPVGVPTSSKLTVRVLFDDGAERDLSTDSRVTFSTPDSACATADDGESANTLRTVSGAVCTSVLAFVTVQLGPFTFVVNATRPVVYVSSMGVSFSGYPDVGTNRDLVVTRVGLVPCLDSVYFHATAKAVVLLTDSTSNDVTSQSSLESSVPEVVYVSSISSTRMEARAAGSATISASFGDQTAASKVLDVQSSVLDAASTLGWAVPQVDRNNLQPDASVSTNVELTYASGLKHSNLASGTFALWIDISSLVSFESSQSSAMQLSEVGSLALLDNFYALVDLRASVACASATEATMSRYANVAAAPMDVDLGSLNGAQFAYSPGASYLDVQVHVRPALN